MASFASCDSKKTRLASWKTKSKCPHQGWTDQSALEHAFHRVLLPPAGLNATHRQKKTLGLKYKQSEYGALF